jgi:glycosyltransferase involved in cell wall biosynthesis
LFFVHDLHYVRALRSAELKKDSSLKARAEQDREEEQNLMSRMDVIFSLSDIETNVIHELCPDVDVFYVPPYSVNVDLSGEFDPEEREGLLFVGGFMHPPNADGVLWFIRDVWPVVRQRLPGVVFSIAGSHPSPEVLALASHDVKVLGPVSDDRLEELYRKSRLVVVPLRYGAGVKGKTVEAMAHGVPVVCTEYGVEGMPGVQDILDPMQHRVPLAEGIVNLYNDIPRLMEISKRERFYVARHFNIENIQTAFTQALMPREQAAGPEMSGSAGTPLG